MEKQQSKNQYFLHLYNQLDEHLRKILSAKPSVSHASLLEQMARKDNFFAHNHSRLQAYRSLRNALVHIPYDGEEPEPIAEPHDTIVEHYRKLVEYIMHPPSALNTIAIKQITTVSWDSVVSEILTVMLDKSYRLAPIIENGVLVGMFDIGIMAFYMNQQILSTQSFSIQNTSTVSLFKSMTQFRHDDLENKHQHVIGVYFASANSSIESVEQIFQQSFTEQKFVSVVCITPTGKCFEPLLGIITAHDLPSANGKVILD